MLSVIVPVYNVSQYLDECLRSIADQSYSDWECILVDDGSKDDSGTICDRWALKDSRFRVIHQQNQGVSVARNNGIKAAKGEYLFFLDSDDWIEPDAFSVPNGADVVLCTQMGKFHKVLKSCNIPLDYLRENILICTGSFFVKRSIVQNNRLYYDLGYKYGEDLAFELKILLSSRTFQIEQIPIMTYRQVPNSAMSKISFDRYDVYFLRLQLIEFAQKKNNQDVVNYLKNFSCVESLVIVTRELLRTGTAVCEIRSFFNTHEEMWNTLKRSIVNPQTPHHFRISAFGIVYLPYFYKAAVVLRYYWYDLHAILGKLKNKLLHR